MCVALTFTQSITEIQNNGSTFYRQCLRRVPLQESLALYERTLVRTVSPIVNLCLATSPLKIAENGYQEKRRNPRGVFVLGAAELSSFGSQYRLYGGGVTVPFARHASPSYFRSNLRGETLAATPLSRSSLLRFFGVRVGCLRDYLPRRFRPPRASFLTPANFRRHERDVFATLQLELTRYLALPVMGRDRNFEIPNAAARKFEKYIYAHIHTSLSNLSIEYRKTRNRERSRETF